MGVRGEGGSESTVRQPGSCRAAPLPIQQHSSFWGAAPAGGLQRGRLSGGAFKGSVPAGSELPSLGHSAEHPEASAAPHRATKPTGRSAAARGIGNGDSEQPGACGAGKGGGRCSERGLPVLCSPTPQHIPLPLLPDAVRNRTLQHLRREEPRLWEAEPKGAADGGEASSSSTERNHTTLRAPMGPQRAAVLRWVPSSAPGCALRGSCLRLQGWKGVRITSLSRAEEPRGSYSAIGAHCSGPSTHRRRSQHEKRRRRGGNRGEGPRGGCRGQPASLCCCSSVPTRLQGGCPALLNVKGNAAASTWERKRSF